MPMMELGEWLPDRGKVMYPGILQIFNLLPTQSGYKTIPQYTDAQLGALDSFCRGALASRSQNGTDFTVAGTETKIWLSTGSDFLDESDPGGYTTDPDERWDFDVYGDIIYGTNFSEPVQKYDLATPPATFTDLSADASLAKVCAVTNEFLMLGDIDGQGVNEEAIGRQEAGLHWCAKGDPSSWPQVATDAAVNVESDFQVLEGRGGCG